MRLVSLVIAACLAGGCDRGMEAPPSDGRPNVLLVLVDTLRRDHVGLYGYNRPTTPLVDELGAEGLVFDRALAQAPSTFISTASIHTGRRFPLLVENRRYKPVPGMRRVRQEEFARIPLLDDGNVTLAEVLAEAGYQTVGLFTNPHHHPTSGFHQGFAHTRYIKGIAHPESYADGSRVNGAFAEWLETRDPSRPFFAYLHYMDVHHPYRPPKDYRLRFVRKVARYLFRTGIPPKDRHPNEDDLRFMQDLYDGEIRYVDDRLREIRGWLADRGILGNTVTIFASDHGEEFLEHGGLGHGRTLDLEMVEVPLVIHGVHGFAPTRVATVVENIDIARTIAEIGEATIPEAFEGRSLLEVSASKLDANAAAFSWEYFRKLRSVTTRSWHAYWNRDEDTFSLYDLTADPDGLEDVATAHAEVAAPFAALVEARDDELAKSREVAERLEEVRDRTPGEIPTDILEQLESLGYLGK